MVGDFSRCPQSSVCSGNLFSKQLLSSALVLEKMQPETQEMFRLTFGQRVMRLLRRAGHWVLAPLSAIWNYITYMVSYGTILWGLNTTQAMITEILNIIFSCWDRLDALEGKVAEHDEELHYQTEKLEEYFRVLVRERFDEYHSHLDSLDERMVNLRTEYANKLMEIATGIAKVQMFGPGTPNNFSKAWELMLKMEELFSSLMDNVTVGMSEMQAEIKMAYCLYEDNSRFNTNRNRSPLSNYEQLTL